MIASRRLRNSGANSRLIASVSSPSRLFCVKPIGRLREVGGAGIRRHDEDDVAEIHLLAVVVGQLAVVHHLQEDVEQVRMRLLDLVEQQHAMRMLVDRRRSAARPGRSRHSRAARRSGARRCAAPCTPTCRSAMSSTPSDQRELPRDLGLADAGRAGEQVGADRLLGVAQAGAGQLDRGGQRLDRLVLAVDDASSVVSRCAAPRRRPSTRSSAGCAPSSRWSPRSP